MNKTMIKLIAKHDNNGNPRRLYLLYIDGIPLKAWNNGYMSVDVEYRQLAINSNDNPIYINPSEYKRLLKFYK